MTTTSDETTCATCGASVSKEEWHPATVETTATGDTRIRSFCGEQCRDQWTDISSEQAADTTQPDTAAD